MTDESTLHSRVTWRYEAAEGPATIKVDLDGMSPTGSWHQSVLLPALGELASAQRGDEIMLVLVKTRTRTPTPPANPARENE